MKLEFSPYIEENWHATVYRGGVGHEMFEWLNTKVDQYAIWGMIGYGNNEIWFPDLDSLLLFKLTWGTSK